MDFSHLQHFLLFFGHGRSGHSLIGSLIDAHKHAVVSHEAFILGRFNNDSAWPVPEQYTGDLPALIQAYDVAVQMEEQQGQRVLVFPQPDHPETLYRYLALMSLIQSEGGRFKATSVYEYFLDYYWQGFAEQPTIIGDKCGGNLALNYRQKPWLVHQLMQFIPLPLKWLHVVRNPFDNIATLSLRNHWPLHQTIDYYMQDEQAVELFAEKEQPDILTVRLEDFIANTEQELREIAAFLDLELNTTLLNACTAIVYDEPNITRHQVDWPPMQIERIQRHIDRTEYMEGYSFNTEETNAK